MKVIRPAFIYHHRDEDKKAAPVTIFSLSVSPDGTRLATAALDTKIKIWSTFAILNEPDQHHDQSKPNNKAGLRLLSTLTSHSGELFITISKD